MTKGWHEDFRMKVLQLEWLNEDMKNGNLSNGNLLIRKIIFAYRGIYTDFSFSLLMIIK